MKKNLTLIIFFAFLTCHFSFCQKQFDVNGVIVPRHIDFKGKQLELNGFGTRSKLWMDVYVQALYLSVLSQDAEAIMNSNSIMGIRIQITSSLVTSKKLSKAFEKGLRKSIGEENIEKIREQADSLERIISREPIVEKDFFNLIYSPEDTYIWVYKNDKLEGKIPGLEFKKTFFGIWLSNNPVDADLKNDLLGK